MASESSDQQKESFGQRLKRVLRAWIQSTASTTTYLDTGSGEDAGVRPLEAAGKTAGKTLGRLVNGKASGEYKEVGDTEDVTLDVMGEADLEETLAKFSIETPPDSPHATTGTTAVHPVDNWVDQMDSSPAANPSSDQQPATAQAPMNEVKVDLPQLSSIVSTTVDDSNKKTKKKTKSARKSEVQQLQELHIPSIVQSVRKSDRVKKLSDAGQQSRNYRLEELVVSSSEEEDGDESFKSGDGEEGEDEELPA